MSGSPTGDELARGLGPAAMCEASAGVPDEGSLAPTEEGSETPTGSAPGIGFSAKRYRRSACPPFCVARSDLRAIRPGHSRVGSRVGVLIFDCFLAHLQPDQEGCG